MFSCFSQKASVYHLFFFKGIISECIGTYLLSEWYIFTKSLPNFFLSFSSWEYCCLVTLKMVRVSQDSLLLANSCCVLNQFFYLLGFWEGGLVSLISVAFNYLCIFCQNSRCHSPERLHLWQQRDSWVSPLCLTSPCPRSPMPAFVFRTHNPGS